MPKGIRNWTYRDVKEFLIKHNFQYHYANGSHHYYVGHIRHIRIVTVPFHGKNKSIKPRTMNSIITQSGIEKSEWFGK